MPPQHMRLLFCLALLSCASMASAQSTRELLQLVNSPYDEKNPVLSPDGQILYMTIGNHPENTDGKRDPGDIWFSRKQGAQWSAPVHAGSLLNNKGYNAV